MLILAIFPSFMIAMLIGLGSHAAPAAEYVYQDTCTIYTAEKNEFVTVQGNVLESATLQDEEGEPPHNYMVILLDHALCLKGSKEHDNLYEINVPISWLGHYVIINGKMEGCADGPNGYCLDVKTIRDVVPINAN